MQHLSLKARLLLIIIGLFVIFPAELVTAAKSRKPMSRGSYNRELNKVNSQIKDVQSHLRETKREQKNVTNQLVTTQRKLETAHDRVIESKLRLARAKDQLRVIGERLERTQRKLERRSRLLAGRLVDIYQGQDIGYVDVLLGSRDMRTFLSRGYYVRQIVTSDVDLVKEIKKDKEQIERDKKAQDLEVRRIAQLQAQLIEQRNSIEQIAQEKQTQLNAIENDRERYERALAELYAKSQEIEDAIRRYYSSNRGGKSYAKKFTGGLGLPVAGRITSRFGYRTHPITGVHSLHTGVDIACPTGTSVHAAASGEVIMAGWMGPYGNAVVIDHGGGVSTLYGHNSRLLVRVGQQITKGQGIARVGSTGWSTGPHLHFEKRINGKPVNPM